MASAIERLAGKGDKLSDIKTRDQHFKINEEFDFLDLSDGELHQIRLLPGVFAHGKHWLDIEITKDGKTKTIPIPKTCLNLDMKTGSFDTTKKDPIFENREYFTAKGKEGETGFQVHYYMCVIDRDAQENAPPSKKRATPSKEEAKTQFKTKGSKTWTPVRVLRIPKGCVEKIVKLAARNIKKGKGGKEAFELSDIKNGRDILIAFDKDASSPANYWDVQIADDPMGPLTQEELGYVIYDIEGAIKKDLAQETLEQMQKWVDDYIAKSDGDDDDSDDDDDDDEDRPTKKAKKKVKKSGKSSRKNDDDDDDDDDLDLDLDDDDDDEEEPKKKTSKVKPKVKTKVKDKAKSSKAPKTSLVPKTKVKSKLKVKKKPKA